MTNRLISVEEALASLKRERQQEVSESNAAFASEIKAALEKLLFGLNTKEQIITTWSVDLDATKGDDSKDGSTSLLRLTLYLRDGVMDNRPHN